MNTIPIHTRVFSKRGIAARIVTTHPQEGYIVEIEIEYPTPDGDYAIEYGEMQHWREVFLTPPREVLEEKVKELSDERQRLYGQVHQLKHELSTLPKQHASLIEKIQKQVPALQRISDFLDGKITHYVIHKSYDWDQIGELTIACLSDRNGDARYERGLKLLNLYGRSNGDLLWAVSQYYDDSGNTKHRVWPCMSEEEALETLKTETQKQYAKWQEKAEGYGASVLANNFTRAGLPIPDDVSDTIKSKKLKGAIARREKLVSELQKVETELSEQA